MSSTSSNPLSDNGDAMLQRVRRIMQGDRYAIETTGIDIVSATAQSVVCELYADQRHANVHGVVMGGALFTLADLAAAVLVNYDDIAADRPLSWVTASSEVHFMAPVAIPPHGQALLTARSSFLKRGRSLAVVQTTVVDATQRTIAHIITSSMHIGNGKLH